MERLSKAEEAEEVKGAPLVKEPEGEGEKSEPVPKEQPARRRRRRLAITVNVIAQEGEAALVEWCSGDARYRVYVPASEIIGEKVSASVLHAGIPYGAPWEEILIDILDSRDISPEALAGALRKRGIWTAEDMERDPRNARRAIDEAIGIRIGELCSKARHIDRR